jgi:tetratricopeptide (TPR) repeat protein
MELDITAISLKGTMEKLAKTQKEARKFQEEAKLAQRRAKQIQKTMDTQKASDNRVVRQLREELKNVTKILETTRRELGKANSRIAQMQRTLDQSQSTIRELTEERDALRIERDSLANILKQNDAAGVRKLITENMRLGKELKETSDRLEFLTKKNTTTQDELLNAKRDLAVAKTRIMRYQKDRTRHSQRILSLESQLRDAEAELAQAKASSDQNANQEEVEILKATVKRLIAAQERRKTAEKILWDTYQNSKKIIPGIVEAIEDIRETKVELTEEEKGLMVLRPPDREFTSPDRVSAEHARAFGSALEKDIADYNRLVKRFYVKGHYEAARQILSDMDEQFPGHFPTLCNRGVLELKTNHFLEAIDIFNEAITMRENSSYAYYMLGLSQYQNNDLVAARNAFQHSLDLKPDNPRAHFYLGNLAGSEKRYQQAEKHFKTAINLDPTMADTYFNLSVLYLLQKKKDQAIEAYRKALENGAQPDPDHERKLGI